MEVLAVSSDSSCFDVERVADLEDLDGPRAERGTPRSMMSATVEMFRDAAAPKGRARDSCPLPIWGVLWGLGRAFGCHPNETTYVVPAKSAVEAPGRRNYQPGGSQDHKKVEEQDA